MYVFAGRLVTGHIARGHFDDLEIFKAAEKDPRLPQSFYPVTEDVMIYPDDVLVSRCHYNSTGSKEPIKFGKKDGRKHRFLDVMCCHLGYFYPREMCGLYWAYHIDSKYVGDQEEDFFLCEGEEFEGFNRNMVFNSVAQQHRSGGNSIIFENSNFNPDWT